MVIGGEREREREMGIKEEGGKTDLKDINSLADRIHCGRCFRLEDLYKNKQVAAVLVGKGGVC